MTSSETMLDNPIWHSLLTRHKRVSIGGELARRFHTEIGPLSGLHEQSEAAYAELAAITSPSNPAVLFLDTPPQLPSSWRMLAEEPIEQMICRSESRPPAHEQQFEILGERHVPEMLALTRLTEPGPFRQRTWELGGFLGIRIDGVLASMAGQRLAPPGFTEVSAVCTGPDFRGQSLAHALVAEVSNRIRARGETPFLTVRQSNTGAIRVYRSAGFEIRRTLYLAVAAPSAT